MTNKVKGFIVTLEYDMREDEIDFIVNAMLMIKGVFSVSPSVTNTDDYMNRQVLKSEFKEKFLKFYNDLG